MASAKPKKKNPYQPSILLLKHTSTMAVRMTLKKSLNPLNIPIVEKSPQSEGWIHMKRLTFLRYRD